ncbi:MAG: PAS domain S-box protein [bacterium]|nr:PAS domain S-box protein [bacterium]
MKNRKSTEQIEMLETKLRHIENDFHLTREEYERSTSKYMKILEELKSKNIELEYLSNNLEKIVEKRTKELSDSEEKFRNLTEAANDAIISIDNKGVIISWNKGAKRMFGYDEEKVIGKEFLYIIPEEHKEFHRNVFEKLKHKEKKWFVDTTVEISGRKPDGDMFFGEVNFSYWYRSRKRYYTCIIRDVTLRKKAAENKLRKEKLFGVIEMAGAACHELNQPLQVISGYSSLLLVEGFDKKTVEAYSNMIHDQIDRLGNITQKLQNITKYKTKDYLDGKIIDIEAASE